MVPFSFAGEEMRLLAARAVYWPREAALLVADLHLEKASFFATCGQLLPPYDSRETLERLAVAIRDSGARRVFALGDNFHDGAGPTRLEPHAAGMLAALTRAVDWVWIAGNHDSAGHDSAGHDSAGYERAGYERAVVRAGAGAGPPGGTQVEELAFAGMMLRHRAAAGETRSEISGHFHPRLQLSIKGRRIVRPCVVTGEGLGAGNLQGSRMILPAFGALTAGMNAGDAAIVRALQPARSIQAVVPSGEKALHFPLWSAAA